MAKYTVSQSSTTGWWNWSCKDGSGSGSSSTKREAKKAGKAACGLANVDIDPPFFDTEVVQGALSNFTVNDLDGNSVNFPVNDISEEEFNFFFGFVCEEEDNDISEAQKAKTILRIWGIYRGGNTVSEIQMQHDLSPSDFNKLIAKDYINLEITIEDNEEIIWDFPA